MIFFFPGRQGTPALWCALAAAGRGGRDTGSAVIHCEGSTVLKSRHGAMAAGGLLGKLAGARGVPALTQPRAVVNIEQEPLKNKAAWTRIPTWKKIKLKETIESCPELRSGGTRLGF